MERKPLGEWQKSEFMDPICLWALPQDPQGVKPSSSAACPLGCPPEATSAPCELFSSQPQSPLARSLPFPAKGRGPALLLGTTGSQQKLPCRCQNVSSSPVLPGCPPLRSLKQLMGRAMEVMERKLLIQRGCSRPPKTPREKAGTMSASHQYCWPWLLWPQQESCSGTS